MDLNELERLANAATPGPWSWTNNEGWAYPQTYVDSEGRANIARFVNGAPQFECTVGEARQEWRNAAFIAAANPFVVLELVRRLREAEKDAARYRWLRQSKSNPAYAARSTAYGVSMLRQDLLDEAIDAAMQSTEAGHEND